MIKRTEMIDIVNELFNLAMKIQYEFIKNSEFSELSVNEMHVIEAVSKEEFPTMGNVARRLRITIGSLTTAVKSIMRKGYLIKEKSMQDQRMVFLKITSKGYAALQYHENFHKLLNEVYSQRIPDDMVEWTYNTMVNIYGDLLEFQKTIKKF